MISLRVKILFFAIFVFYGCGQPSSSDLITFSVSEQAFSSIVTETNKRYHESIRLLNRDYPIEIILYSNGHFYYDLPNLGDGKGKWHYENGRLKLFAKRSLFNMNFTLLARDSDLDSAALKFSDRFGPKILHLEIIRSNN